jgi:hypothetical protein
LVGRYVLVRISGNAGYDLMRCRRCNGKHPYLTLMCEPQPFSGAYRGVHAYFHALGVAGAELDMSPADRERFRSASRLFGPAGGLPHLATSHPRLARQLGTAERDVDVGSFPLGVLEPIGPTVAQRLLDRINARGPTPPLVVPGLTTNGRLGVLAELAHGGLPCPSTSDHPTT